ncbi:hypothetical protein Btru_043644 [Bulinus truncatus]|nr:hypothetical protein Btru_043644 [Bulinus truncatus]
MNITDTAPVLPKQPLNISEVTEYINAVYFMDTANVDVDFILKNGHVQFIYMNHHVAPLIRCSEKLVELARKRGLFVSQDVIKGKVRQVQDNFRTLKRNIKRSWPQMKNHLEQDFNFTQKRQPEQRSPVNQAAKRSKLGDKENHSVSPAAPCTPLPSPLSTLQPAAPDTPQLAGTTPTRHSARCCHHRRLISLTAGLKERLERAKAEVRVLKKTFQTSRINQELCRKNSLIEKLREERRQLKKANFSLLKENNSLCSQLEELANFKRLAKRRQERINTLNEIVSSLKASSKCNCGL